MTREKLTQDEIDKSIEVFLNHLRQKIKEKGTWPFVSSHEALGSVKEEYDELGDAVREDDEDQICRELLDLGVAALWGATSQMNGRFDW